MTEEFERVSFSAMWSDGLEKVIKERSTKPYPIRFGFCGSDYTAFANAVNQGIDSHLEAIQFTSKDGTYYISQDTLHVLVRRLMESGNEHGETFGSSICETLGIELI